MGLDRIPKVVAIVDGPIMNKKDHASRGCRVHQTVQACILGQLAEADGVSPARPHVLS